MYILKFMKTHRNKYLMFEVHEDLCLNLMKAYRLCLNLMKTYRLCLKSMLNTIMAMFSSPINLSEACRRHRLCLFSCLQHNYYKSIVLIMCIYYIYTFIIVIIDEMIVLAIVLLLLLL